MASWTLGKIFSVNEDEAAIIETGNEVSESGSDDDDEAQAAQAAFKKNKSSSSLSRHNEISGSGSIRRYDEYGDFISRSERARAEKTHQPPPAAAKRVDSGGSVAGHKRKVGFRGDGQLFEVKEIPPLTDEDKAACYMSTENCMFDIWPLDALCFYMYDADLVF
jgi:hypothetical protein